MLSASLVDLARVVNITFFCLFISHINTSMFHAALTQTADAHAGNGTATDTVPDASQPPTLVQDCLAVIDDY